MKSLDLFKKNIGEISLLLPLEISIISMKGYEMEWIANEKRMDGDIFSGRISFCKVKPEETGVFYKYYEEGFHLVMFIDGTNGYLPTMGQLQVMQERVQELFIIRWEGYRTSRKDFRCTMWNS